MLFHDLLFFSCTIGFGAAVPIHPVLSRPPVVHVEQAASDICLWWLTTFQAAIEASIQTAPLSTALILFLFAFAVGAVVALSTRVGRAILNLSHLPHGTLKTGLEFASLPHNRLADESDGSALGPLQPRARGP